MTWLSPSYRLFLLIKYRLLGKVARKMHTGSYGEVARTPPGLVNRI